MLNFTYYKLVLKFDQITFVYKIIKILIRWDVLYTSTISMNIIVHKSYLALFVFLIELKK